MQLKNAVFINIMRFLNKKQEGEGGLVWFEKCSFRFDLFITLIFAKFFDLLKEFRRANSAHFSLKPNKS